MQIRLITLMKLNIQIKLLQQKRNTNQNMTFPKALKTTPMQEVLFIQSGLSHSSIDNIIPLTKSGKQNTEQAKKFTKSFYLKPCALKTVMKKCTKM